MFQSNFLPIVLLLLTHLCMNVYSLSCVCVIGNYLLFSKPFFGVIEHQPNAYSQVNEQIILCVNSISKSTLKS